MILSYFLFATPPETSSQFTFYSYCLSLLKVKSELPLLGLDLLYKGNFSNTIHSKNCYNFYCTV